MPYLKIQGFITQNQKNPRTWVKKIEISMDALYDLVDNLPEEECKKLLQRLKAKSTKLKRFKEAKIDAILADFAATNLYEEDFLKDLEEGLKKSSVYQQNRHACYYRARYLI